MISRRNIRVKVMQALYAYEQNFGQGTAALPAESRDTSLYLRESKTLLKDKINRSAALFHLLLTYVCNVAQYAKTDAKKRASKYLATEEDRNVNASLAENKVLAKLWAEVKFQEQRENFHIDNAVSEEWVKKLFKQLAATEAYSEYLLEKEHSPASDKKIMVFIWKEIILKNESFLTDLADDWINWEDDSDLVKILVENYFNKPGSINFLHFISEEKQEYAESLLRTVIEKQDLLLASIKPKLNNWDSERIAQIDLVLLQMGLAEFLFFPTIPVKVTINEYIDIAKNYSTDQSGQFVNGVLDNLRKDLLSENKLRKIERSK